jgi:hypothetical protein
MIMRFIYFVELPFKLTFDFFEWLLRGRTEGEKAFWIGIFFLDAWLLGAAALAYTASPRTLHPWALSTPSLTCKAYDLAGVEIYRSRNRRNLFIRMTGGPRPGMYVNHIVPLACGGCDVPSNMEWMTETDWAARTVPERTDCGRHKGGVW